MSLLLQALQKAARNRQVGGPEPTTGEGPQLELEPRDVAEFTSAAGGFGADPGGISAVSNRGVSPAAATILAAADPAGATIMDHLRERPVVAFGSLALLFAVLYGIYLYIEIAHPLWLRGQFSSPSQVVSSTPAPTPNPSASIPATPPPDSQFTPTPALAPMTASVPGVPEASSSNVPPGSAGGAAPNSELAALMNLPTNQDPPSKAPEVATGIAKLGNSLSELDKLTKELAPPPRPQKPVEAPPVPRPNIPAKAPVRPVASVPARTTPPPVASAPTKSAVSGPKRLSQGGQQPVIELNDQVIVNAAPGTPLLAGTTVADAYKAWKSGKLDQAKTMYFDVLENDGKNVDALLGVAGIAQQQGNSQEALNHFGRVLELDPRNSAAQAGIIAMTGQSDPGASEARLKLLISREPSAFLNFSLGNLYARQSQWKLAQQSYFQAYQMDADNSDYAYNLAVSLEHIGQGKLAITYYRKALDLSLKQGRATFNQEQVIDRIAKLSLRSN